MWLWSSMARLLMQEMCCSASSSFTSRLFWCLELVRRSSPQFQCHQHKLLKTVLFVGFFRVHLNISICCDQTRLNLIFIFIQILWHLYYKNFNRHSLLQFFSLSELANWELRFSKSIGELWVHNEGHFPFLRISCRSWGVIGVGRSNLPINMLIN